MNTTMKACWKMISSLTLSTNLLLVACGTAEGAPGSHLDEGSAAETGDVAVQGAVTGALSAEGELEVIALWKNEAGDVFAADRTPVDQLTGEFRLALPETPPDEALVPLGGTTAASASVTLTLNGEFYAQSEQMIIFASEDLALDGEDIPDVLRNLRAGYHLVQEDENGEPSIVPFDSVVEIEVNSAENCHFRLRAELEECEEREGADAGCSDAHQERVEACAAGA
ncbi:MAG: hypothetical protein ACO3JL_16375 [Myxococcota bacterium]